MRMIVGFLRKALVLQVRFTLTASPTPQSLHFLLHHFYPFSSSSTSIPTSERSESFTVSYLIDSCGLSHEDALSASKLLRFETPEKPDSVLAFFNSHGFSKSQTSKIVKSLPRLLASDPDKTLLPKLQFFYSKGASKPDVAKIVVSTPGILKRSLENQIIPSFNFLKDFLQSDEMAITVVKRFSRILLFDLHTYVASNMNALQEFGVPKSNIAGLLMSIDE
ncbi:transcription termination factor MTEF1, chloroplastic-like [Vitis riparia]|uniref:transcription termination factor MTEF1, chloroplastic-like n=1 Tax=Vitis riparia TaxID=96939 RepID=UPI00155AD8EF|nr:transcription termination factor MTEF1, chloroplastic-like [Vitis riparia]